jgi:RecT family
MFDIAKIEEKIDHVVSAETVIAGSIGGIQIDRLNKAAEVAKLMAIAKGMVPSHCRGEPGVCMAITCRALAWEMDPFAVASQTYVTKPDAPVAFMAMLVHAVINTRAGLKGRLNFEYAGEGPTRQIKVIGTFRDGAVREYLSPMKKDIKVKNSPLWDADLDQQLAYYGVRAWGRRWVPEVLLGVYTPDETEQLAELAKDVTPVKKPPKLIGKRKNGNGGGFNHEKVQEAVAEAQGAPLVEPAPPADTPVPVEPQTEPAAGSEGILGA